MFSLLHVSQLLLLTVVFVSGCFITNCPPGGKRSESEEKTHQCEQCGPPGMGGRCYGPKICCSPQFGCMIGSPITAACNMESRSPSLCHNQAPSCDGGSDLNLNGQCAAVGLCCTPETCTVDEDCTNSVLTATDASRHHPLHLKPLLLQHFDEPENLIPVIHGPTDAWFYRRFIHSKAKTLNSVDGKNNADSEVGPMPQGPPYFPLGSPRLADYF